MCGRYALALRASQVRQVLHDDGMSVEDAPPDEGPGASRVAYNFAPGYTGIIYRAETPDWGAGPRPHNDGEEATCSSTALAKNVNYKLQSMRWGLIPFWTTRKPDYSSALKTINCRDDSLATPGGLWATMKARKRCIVVAQGFYEWLKVGPKKKVPHYAKRKDGRLMCFAGLWDCAQYEDSDDKVYTYTIVTTDSNPQLGFLHDRMPAILNPGSEELRTWLDPQRHEWSRELQKLLKPFEGDLDVYPVVKDVGKVGNESPNFVVPRDSKENKANIANFFANDTGSKLVPRSEPMSSEKQMSATTLPGLETKKRGAPHDEHNSRSPKNHRTQAKDDGSHVRQKISPTKNSSRRSVVQPKGSVTPRITDFFGQI